MRGRYLIYFVILIFLIISTIFIGRYSLPEKISDYWNDVLLRNLILRIRLPRIIVSLIVGAGLAVSGLVMQNVFQNPLADPGVLGISQAAGFGAAMGFLLFPSLQLPVQVLAFICGILALVLVLKLAQLIKISNRISLIFAGIAVSAFFTAGLGIIKYLADPLDQLPSIVFWLLGSLSSTTWRTVLQVAPISLICISILYMLRWRINIYSMDEEVLFSLGVKGKREVNLILGLTVLLTTSIISITGLVGWVGLIIPNIARLGFGYDTKQSLPAAIITGSAFVLICDTIARASLPGEIPLGILTAFLGAGVFIFLLQTKRDFISNDK